MDNREILAKIEERYYWQTQEGQFIPVDELTDLHVVNIVIKFGKNYLSSHKHNLIIERFEKLRKESGFYV